MTTEIDSLDGGTSARALARPHLTILPPDTELRSHGDIWPDANIHNVHCFSSSTIIFPAHIQVGNGTEASTSKSTVHQTGRESRLVFNLYVSITLNSSHLWEK